MHLLALGAQCALLLQLVLYGSDRLSKVRLDRLRVGGACAAAQAHTDDFGRGTWISSQYSASGGDRASTLESTPARLAETAAGRLSVQVPASETENAIANRKGEPFTKSA